MGNKKEVFLIRHGQGMGPVLGIRQTSEHGLSPLGRIQVKQLATCFPRVDLIISSPWTRAIETARLLKNGANIEIDKDIHERKEPTSITGLNLKNPISQSFLAQLISNRENIDFKVDDGESMREVANRAKDFKDRLCDLNINRIAVVSHSYFLRAFLANEMVGPIQNQAWNSVAWSFFLDNTGVSFVEYSDNRFKVHYINDTSHLKNGK